MTSHKHILLISDNAVLNTIVQEHLILYELSPPIIVSSHHFSQDSIDAYSINLIILNIEKQEKEYKNGYAIYTLLTQSNVQAPIIMITHDTLKTRTINTITREQDDYLIKPFHYTMLLSHIEAKLALEIPAHNHSFLIGEYEFSPQKKQLIKQDKTPIYLTEKETNILKCLCNTHESPVTKEKLLEEVWGYNTDITTHTLETHIHRLRKKLQKYSTDHHLLVTDKEGYRITQSSIKN